MLSIGIRKSEGRCAKNVNRVRSERRNEAEDASDAWDIFVCYLAMEAKFCSHLSQDGVEFCPKSPRRSSFALIGAKETTGKIIVF